MYWAGSFSSEVCCSCVRVSAILLPPPSGFEAEVVLVELLDARQLFFREVRPLGGGGELFELLLIVDVGQGRGDLGRGQDELQGCLSRGALPGLGEEAELIDLFKDRKSTRLNSSHAN